MATTITQINQSTKQAITEALNEAFSDVADQFGLDYEISNIKSDLTGMKGKFRLKITLDDDGNVIDKDKEQFERRAFSLGLPEDWYLKQFREGGKQFVIVALFPSRPKNCIQIKRLSDSKTFVCSPKWIRSYL